MLQEKIIHNATLVGVKSPIIICNDNQYQFNGATVTFFVYFALAEAMFFEGVF